MRSVTPANLIVLEESAAGAEEINACSAAVRFACDGCADIEPLGLESEIRNEMLLKCLGNACLAVAPDALDERIDCGCIALR